MSAYMATWGQYPQLIFILLQTGNYIVLLQTGRYIVTVNGLQSVVVVNQQDFTVE